ncbi:MAG: SRPBCC family protein [Bacteroidota bacterium]
MEINLDITINRPVAEVFDYFVAPKNLKNWVYDFNRFLPVKGKNRRKGDKAKHIFGKGKNKLEVVEEVLENKRHEVFEVFMSVKNMHSLNTYTFESLEDNSTRIMLHLDIKMKPAILNLVSPIMKGSFKSQQSRDLRKLKEVLENK